MADLEWNDISSEQYREYDFGAGNVVRIDAPVKLNVSASGGHRVLDGAGVSHYLPKGWFHLSWKVKDGRKAFDF